MRAPSTDTWEEVADVVGVPILGYLREIASRMDTVEFVQDESLATHYWVSRVHPVNGDTYVTVQPGTANTRVIEIGGVAYLVTVAPEDLGFFVTQGFWIETPNGLELRTDETEGPNRILEKDTDGYWRIGDGVGYAGETGYIGKTTDQGADDGLRIYAGA